MPNTINSVVFLSLGLLFHVVSAGIPPEIQKCKAADTSCIANRIMEILKRYPKGNSDFGLIALDKLSLKNLILSQTNSNGPVQIQFKLKTADVYGIEKSIINRVIGFEDDLEKSKFEVYGIMPSLVIKGDYEANGKILLLPIIGNGDSEIKLKNVQFGVKAKLGQEMRNGKRYGVLKKFKVQMEPENMQVRLDNLFNGNKELSDSMQQIINDNWKDIWSELSVNINKFVEKILSNSLKEVLKELSYDDFYKN